MARSGLFNCHSMTHAKVLRAVVKVQLGQTCVCVSVGGDFARVPTFWFSTPAGNHTPVWKWLSFSLY